jgi:tRNA (guanine-N7-)-methyltransferase
MEDRHRRPIRSFVRRSGRLTSGQARAIERYGERYCLPPGAAKDLDRAFARRAPRVLEIGFGDGECLAELARRHPDADFLGIEVHEPGVGHLLRELAERDIDNVRVIVRDAVEVLADELEPASLDVVNLFFPDPWPKKRHHKRRIVQPGFVATVASRLKPGGLLHVATDWAPYAEWIVEIMATRAEFRPLAALEAAAEPLAERPQTKFERRGLRLGHAVTDLWYRRR